MKFRPPTIAVVYKFESRPDITSKSTQTKREKKYIHEILVDNMNARSDLTQLCNLLCEKEH